MRRAAWTPPAGRPPRILLVRLSALGDVLHALPVLAGLRSALPAAEVDWLVEDRFAPLLEGHPDLRRVIAFPRQALRLRLLPWPSLGQPVARAAGFVRTLRAGDYDLALDLQGNLKSGVLARLSGAVRVLGPARAASREGNHLLLHRAVRSWPTGSHKVERGLGLLEATLGQAVPFSPPLLPLGEADHAEALVALAAAGLSPTPPLVVHPGSSGFGAFKRWPLERFAALTRRLASTQSPAAITFGPGEARLAESLAQASAGTARPVPTASLRTLAALLARARLVVAGDTGPLHLAALQGVPVVGIYGPKDPAVYGPYGLRADGTAGPLPSVVQPDVACRPCTLRRCAAPLCLTTLAPERVLAAVVALGPLALPAPSNALNRAPP